MNKIQLYTPNTRDIYLEFSAMLLYVFHQQTNDSFWRLSWPLEDVMS